MRFSNLACYLFIIIIDIQALSGTRDSGMLFIPDSDSSALVERELVECMARGYYPSLGFSATRCVHYQQCGTHVGLQTI